MKKLITSALLAIFCNVVYAQQLEWSNKKLTWDDFKGPVSNKNSFDTSFASTGISYNMTYDPYPGNGIHVNVTAILDEDKSWKKPEVSEEYQLNHEQLHFDIAEIYARKVRQMVEEKIKTAHDFEMYFKKEYQVIFDEYQAFQQKYDKETGHSLNKEKQEEYNYIVSKMLTDLKAYQKQ